MDRITRRVVPLAVADPRTGAHSLHVPWADDRASAEAVFVLERAFEHVRNDLHVAMSMHPEAGAGIDPILVDDAQGPKAHLVGVVIVGEGERVAAVEPVGPRVASFAGRPDRNHEHAPSPTPCTRSTVSSRLATLSGLRRYPAACSELAFSAAWPAAVRTTTGIEAHAALLCCWDRNCHPSMMGIMRS